jgi:Mn2+/Fe2+ NRAMP family transporter
VALVGGTVGGYISFAGAHRLLEAGIRGESAIPKVNRGAVSGILLTSTMRYILFLAALGVVAGGYIPGHANPAADVFRMGAGRIGFAFFGIVLWSAAITSVIGASFTSVSFWKTAHPLLEKNQRWLVTGFILVSATLFILLRQPPATILVLAGIVNGLILPLALAIMLLAVNNKRLFPGYRHPLWMQAAGWMVVALMSWLSWLTIQQGIRSL